MLHCDENKLVIDFIHEKSFIVLGLWYMAQGLAGTKQMKFSQLNILGVPTLESHTMSSFPSFLR